MEMVPGHPFGTSAQHPRYGRNVQFGATSWISIVNQLVRNAQCCTGMRGNAAQLIDMATPLSRTPHASARVQPLIAQAEMIGCMD